MSRPNLRGHRVVVMTVVSLVLALTVIAWVPLRAQTEGSDQGRELFDSTCSACHTIGGGVLVGPDLKAVTERRDRDWLERFILDPEQFHETGDPIAAENLAKFGMPMPTLGLTEDEVAAVITHLQASETTIAVRPALYLPTLALAVLAIGGITVIALRVGTKRTEIGS